MIGIIGSKNQAPLEGFVNLAIKRFKNETFVLRNEGIVDSIFIKKLKENNINFIIEKPKHQGEGYKRDQALEMLKKIKFNKGKLLAFPGKKWRGNKPDSNYKNCLKGWGVNSWSIIAIAVSFKIETFVWVKNSKNAPDWLKYIDQNWFTNKEKSWVDEAVDSQTLEELKKERQKRIKNFEKIKKKVFKKIPSPAV